MVPRVVFGRGSFDQLGEILKPKRKAGAPFIFLVDDVFKGKDTIIGRIPLEQNDEIIYISAEDEPKTTYVDQYRDDIAANHKTVSGIIGIGGSHHRPGQGNRH